MPNHTFEKSDLIRRLEAYLGKTFETIDNKGIFDQVREFQKQKGIAGTVVEQCIFEYPPDSAQAADLLVVDGGESTKTELKTTGLLIENSPRKHYVAKEPMSITAVGVYDIAEQTFETSHFWEKLEHMLIVYYHYTANHAVSAYEYKDFPLVGYEFHEFSEQDIEVLRRDWEYVRSLCETVVSHHDGVRNAAWKSAVKDEYIQVHGELRRLLSYIDLAPKFPPRFRLKKPTVSSIVSEHFGFELEQLPVRYDEISDIDNQCRIITEKHKGQSIEQLAQYYKVLYNRDRENKAVTEKITVAMFGGASSRLNQIKQFSRFGLIAKSITITPAGSKTEDMKLFRIDFNEICQTVYWDDEECREYQFEDSDLYSYFADHEFLCIIFEEPEHGDKNKLGDNVFVGFKRLIFSEDFIENVVKPVWQDTRNKIMNKTLVDVVETKGDGTPVINKSGTLKSAPNFIKSSENPVFLRGSGADSSIKSKIEMVNGIRMLPQYVWIKGDAVISELEKISEL